LKNNHRTTEVRQKKGKKKKFARGTAILGKRVSGKAVKGKRSPTSHPTVKNGEKVLKRRKRAKGEEIFKGRETHERAPNQK